MIERNKTQWEGGYGSELHEIETNHTGRNGTGEAVTGRDRTWLC